MLISPKIESLAEDSVLHKYGWYEEPRTITQFVEKSAAVRKEICHVEHILQARLPPTHPHVLDPQIVQEHNGAIHTYRSYTRTNNPGQPDHNRLQRQHYEA